MPSSMEQYKLSDLQTDYSRRMIRWIQSVYKVYSGCTGSSRNSQLKGNSEITWWQAHPIFIKSESLCILHSYCNCELKSERNLASVPLFNYKSTLTPDVWKQSLVIFFRTMIMANHRYERNSRYTTYQQLVSHLHRG